MSIGHNKNWRFKKIKGLERERNLVWRYPIKFGYMCVYPYTESNNNQKIVK